MSLILKQLAKQIHDEVYKRSYAYKYTIFLCGAGADKSDSIRDSIDRFLTQEWYSFLYDLFYPEDLFDELLFGPSHQDLISLENILADSVDAIVLIIESYGAVAELGAFSSNTKLRKKLVCVVDAKYKKKKSFINYGPLRLMKDKKEGFIVYGDYSDVSNMIEPIRKAISKASKTKTKSAKILNVIQAHHFILPCIYLLEPVQRDTLLKLVEYASGKNKKISAALTTGALSISNKNHEIQLTSQGYRLTPAGLTRFKNLGRRGRTRNLYDLKAMDEMRVAIMNWQLRGKKLKN
jgi:hypothetical protein